MSSSLPSTTAVAATMGILGSAWTSGGQAMLSMLAVRGLLVSTSSPVAARALAEQWAEIYNRGKVIGPRAAVLSLLGYGFLAFQHRGKACGFVAAAALTLSIVPFTEIFMGQTNKALLAAADASKELGQAEVRELLARWKELNSIRALPPLAGAGLALWTVL